MENSKQTLHQGTEIIIRAIQQDKQENYKEAFELYLEGVRLLLPYTQRTENESEEQRKRRNGVFIQVKKYLSRVAQIQKIHLADLMDLNVIEKLFVFKLVCGTDIRRWTLDTSKTKLKYRSLIEHIYETFPALKEFEMSYISPNNKEYPLSNEEAFGQAVIGSKQNDDLRSNFIKVIIKPVRLNNNLPLEQVNRLYPDREKYVNLLFELLSAHQTTSLSFDCNKAALPFVYFDTITWIVHHALREEGIFRMSPAHDELQKLKILYKSGKRKDFDKDENPHLVCFLLRDALRGLNDPIWPAEFVQPLEKLFKMADNNNNSADLRNKLALKFMIQHLPNGSKVMLQALSVLLKLVSFHSSENKMNVENLARMFSLSIVRPDESNFQAFLETTPLSICLVKSILQHIDTVFSEQEVVSEDQLPKDFASDMKERITQLDRKRKEIENMDLTGKKPNNHHWLFDWVKGPQSADIEGEWEFLSSMRSGQMLSENMNSPQSTSEKPEIERESIEMEQLRKEVQKNGLSEDNRALGWKVLLGYMPTEKSKHETFLKESCELYLSLHKKHQADYHPNDKELNQIRLDVPRTWPTGAPLEIFGHPQVALCLERVLFLWAKQNPHIKYFQGLPDIAAQFILVFLNEYWELEPQFFQNELTPETMLQVETDTFFCLIRFTSGLDDHFVSHFSKGFNQLMGVLDNTIKEADYKFHQHLEKHKIDFLLFTFPWFLCFFSRDLDYRILGRLWDTYFAVGPNFQAFHIAFITAFILHWSDQAKTLDSFSQLLVFLQHPPVQSWTLQDITSIIERSFLIKVLMN